MTRPGIEPRSPRPLAKANFLDITFDLNNNFYKPVNKNNDIPSYIENNSNHPRCIIMKQIPTAVKNE